MSLTCAITIATRNRQEDLARTCAVVRELQPPAQEVLICADGCTDGTVEFIRREYPHFQLIVNANARGSIASRDLMIRQAASDIMISLDDDSYPIETDFVEFVQILFRENPKLAVASFPQRSNEFPKSLTVENFGASYPAGTFANCAAAIRRSCYVEVGGYPAIFFHMYEEPDFALQCLAAGFEVMHVTNRIVRHHYTPQQRSEIGRSLLHARNELWSVMMRCPLPYLLPVAAFRIVRQFGYACTKGGGWVVRQPFWWTSFLRGLPAVWRQRKALPWPAYWHWMQRIRNAPKQEK